MRLRFRAVVMVTAFALAARGATDSATFNKDVLPILQKNCQVCHRPGEANPKTLVKKENLRQRPADTPLSPALK